MALETRIVVYTLLVEAEGRLRLSSGEEDSGEASRRAEPVRKRDRLPDEFRKGDESLLKDAGDVDETNDDAHWERRTPGT